LNAGKNVVPGTSVMIFKIFFKKLARICRFFKLKIMLANARKLITTLIFRETAIFFRRKSPKNCDHNIGPLNLDFRRVTPL
jgi:hypothetical protein